MKRLFVCLLFFCFSILEADAASKFWVGGGTNTNWNASPTTNWALTSGGAGNQAIPTAGDDVFFDANSGTGASVWQTTVSIGSLNCTGSKNIVTHQATITLSVGDVILPTGAGGTYTATVAGIFSYNKTSGIQRFTSSGFNPGGISMNGAGGTLQLQDNLALFLATGSAITLSNGTLDTQGFTVSTALFIGGGAGTRVLTGSGAWTIGTANATGTIWNWGGGTSTFTSFTSDITITGTTSALRTFAGGGYNYTGTFTVGANSSGGVVSITGANTFGHLAVTAPNFIMLVAGTTQTISNAPTIAGTSGTSAVGFSSSTLDTSATISVASGTASFDWAAFRDMTGAGGATFTATNSFDMGRNSNITITAPASFPGGGGGCILGGWLLWRDLPQHINDNYPAWIDKAA